MVFDNCHNIWIENCYFENASLNFINSQNITVTHCDMLSSQGSATSHAILFNQCNGVQLLNSYFKEPLGQSSLSDIVNSYKSQNVLFQNNYLTGGGPSSQGGGLIFDNFGRNQFMSDNICVDCGQYGLATSGGIGNTIVNNQAYSLSHPWSNVGFYAEGWAARSLTLTNVIVANNTAGWTNKNGQSNGWWLGPNVYNISVTGNNFHASYTVPPVPSGIGSSFLQH